MIANVTTVIMTNELLLFSVVCTCNLQCY